MSTKEHFRQQAAVLFREAGEPISKQILEYMGEQKEVGKREEALVEVLVGFVLVEWFNRSDSFFDFNERCEKNYPAIMGSIVSVMELMCYMADEEKIPDQWKGILH